jgi:nicotinamidase/pyrazinamidase
MPGGTLGVPGADQIVPLINQLMPYFEHVLATQDWHPADHVSFKNLWPVHCVEQTLGAELVKELKKERIERYFRKGTELHRDSYSAFGGTDLEAYLRDHHLSDLYFVGVATDFCVFHSAADALNCHFKVTVIRDACRGIEKEEEALATLQSKGAQIISFDRCLQLLKQRAR